MERQTRICSSQSPGCDQDASTLIADTLDNEPAIEIAQKLEGLTARQQEAVSQADARRAGAGSGPGRAGRGPGEAAGLRGVRSVAYANGGPRRADRAARLATPPWPRDAGTGADASRPRGRQTTKLAEDTTYGLTWLQVTTSNVSFVMPANWRLLNVERRPKRRPDTECGVLGIDTAGDPPVIISSTPRPARSTASIKCNSVRLRAAGPNGATIAPDVLIAAQDRVTKLAWRCTTSCSRSRDRHALTVFTGIHYYTRFENQPILPDRDRYAC